QTTVDADRIKALGVPAYQITTGNICHLDARMVHNVLHEFKLDGFDILFIENVGNLVCPAEFYLGEDLRVMVYSVVEGAEKPKKYPLMFHEVEVVLLNKIDLLPYAGVELKELEKNVLEVNPNAFILSASTVVCKSPSITAIARSSLRCLIITSRTDVFPAPGADIKFTVKTPHFLNSSLFSKAISSFA
ncbi:hydrogenase accessory protein HypB, partial [Candidatus Kryptonium thompsonii]